MSLRKSLIGASWRLAANQVNAQDSAGPKTAQGKARSRWNGLRFRKRSKDLQRLENGGEGEARVIVDFLGEMRKKQSKIRTTEARMSFGIRGRKKRTHQVIENKGT